MTGGITRRASLKALFGTAASMAIPTFGVGTAHASVTALKLSIAEAASSDRDLAAFYRARDFAPLFLGEDDGPRRGAVLEAFATAEIHGLPSSRYASDELRQAMGSASNSRDLGRVEVSLAKQFLKFADDLKGGIIEPRRVDTALHMDVPVNDRTSILSEFERMSPREFVHGLSPTSNAYVRLQKEKLRLEGEIAKGGWGPKIDASKLSPGDTGAAVVALRNRLIAIGYLDRNVGQVYNGSIQNAVQAFQLDHGIVSDGVATRRTIAELNSEPEERLDQVLVALERRRWNNRALEDRHVWVNIPDFHVDVMEDGVSAFRSRVVVGKNVPDRQTPEFSDEMEFMVINPSWYVPRSIVTKEYLPKMQRNPNAHSYLQVIGRNGRPVSRSAVNFSAYNARNFPYSMRQPPSRRNALGLVKFMFPNRHNIYLHDTPAKELFGREKRDFSHGCIRVHKPFELAYHLLSHQEGDPEGFFHSNLRTGSERRVDLKEKLPVHLVYYTAWVDARGRPQYRNDVYGRDRRILGALNAVGVSSQTVRS